MWQAGNSLAASPLANSLAGEAREGNWRLRRRSPAHASRQLRRLGGDPPGKWLFAQILGPDRLKMEIRAFVRFGSSFCRLFWCKVHRVTGDLHVNKVYLR